MQCLDEQCEFVPFRQRFVDADFFLDLGVDAQFVSVKFGDMHAMQGPLKREGLDTGANRLASKFLPGPTITCPPLFKVSKRKRKRKRD